MPKKKKESPMIYESPDGGATVYARPIDGKGERVLIEKPIFPDWYLNEVEISEIVAVSYTHLTLPTNREV